MLVSLRIATPKDILKSNVHLPQTGLVEDRDSCVQGQFLKNKFHWTVFEHFT